MPFVIMYTIFDTLNLIMTLGRIRNHEFLEKDVKAHAEMSSNAYHRAINMRQSLNYYNYHHHHHYHYY